MFRSGYDASQYFLTTREYSDKERSHIKTYHYEGNKLVYDWTWQGLELHFVIEAGYMQYLFSIERYVDESGKVVLNPKLIKKFNVTEKKSKAPLARLDTMFAISSGVPHLLMGVIPSEISLSYFSLTLPVISVAIIPGRTSNTGMLYSARRSAKSVVTIETPAFEIQYSPLDVEDVYADIDPIFTILGL